MAVACVAMATGAATSVAYAWLAGPILAAIFGRPEHSTEGLLLQLRGMPPSWAALSIAAVLAGVSIVRALTHYAQSHATSGLVAHGVADLRHAIASHLLHAEPSAVWNLSRGEIGARITADVDRVASLIQSLLTGSRSFVTFVVVASYALWTDPVLGGIAVASVPVLAWVASRFAAIARVHRRQALQLESETSGRIAEAVTMAGVVQSYEATERVAAHFRSALDRVRETFARSAKYSNLAVPTTIFLGTLGVGATLYVGALRLESGAVTPQEHVTFLAAAMLLFGPIRGLAGMTGSSAVGLAALDRLMNLLGTPRHRPDAADARAIGPFGDRLILTGISFAYGSRPILSDISGEIRKGQSLVIIGPSGSGKTTLVRILLGLLHPTAGRVTLDGVSQTDARRDSWFEQFAWVPQEPLLFGDSVAANISLGKASSDPGAVARAAASAGAAEFIAQLPMGYETILSEGGGELSTGQRQRICIARALFRNAPILVLDEPTSALDPSAADELSRTIDELLRTRTIVIVSHRPETIRRANNALLLSADGKMIAHGPVAELMTSSVSFRSFLREPEAHAP